MVHNQDSSDGSKADKLTKQQAKMLKEAGYDPEQLKKEVLGSKAKVTQFDLFMDENGDMFVKPKSGKGPGEPLGLNFKKIVGLCN